MALAGFLVGAAAGALIGEYWLALSQLGFAGASGAILAGADERGGVPAAVCAVSLVVGVVAIVLGSLRVL